MGLDQAAFSAQVLRWMMTIDWIPELKVVILRHLQLSTTGRRGRIKEKDERTNHGWWKRAEKHAEERNEARPIARAKSP